MFVGFTWAIYFDKESLTNIHNIIFIQYVNNLLYLQLSCLSEPHLTVREAGVITVSKKVRLSYTAYHF